MEEGLVNLSYGSLPPPKKKVLSDFSCMTVELVDTILLGFHCENMLAVTNF